MTAMESLNDREKHILMERRLADEPKTLEELSQVYGVSRERIRQIEVRAFEKLQAALLRLAGERRLLPGGLSPTRRNDSLLPSVRNRRTVSFRRARPSAFLRLARPQRHEGRVAWRGESKGTRVIALVGPAGAGKTSLAEAMLFAAGATDRLGSTANGSSIGDSSRGSARSAAARPSSTSTISNISATRSPSSIARARSALPPTARGRWRSPTSRSSSSIPIRRARRSPPRRCARSTSSASRISSSSTASTRRTAGSATCLSALQPMSVSPLIARQIPIWDGEKVSGFVDLALERAFKYRPGKESERIEIPSELQEREIEARTHMLEQLADHDDELLEQLLMDQAPTPEKVFQDLARETGESLGVSVLFGSANSSWGVRRLLKALRHEAPGPQSTADRLGVTDPAMYVFKIIHGSIGRLALSRVLGGHIAEGSDLKTEDGEHARVGSLFKVQGEKTQKVGEGRDGDVVAVAKVDEVKVRRMARRGQASAADRDRLSGAQLRDRDRARRPQG